jgi:leader peptidase (prepilin peptidase)/N-methyltransferase
MVMLGLGFFIIGTVVGSFLNVCIYRIPWEKSVVWPGSRCPNCLAPIAARDNIPIVSWLALRAECRSCGASISARYPMVEALVGCLFLGAFVLASLSIPPDGFWRPISPFQVLVAANHCLFFALLVAATFIDYDLMIIPREITVTGVVVGIGLGTLIPQIRPAPVTATSHLQGFWIGLLGLVVGAGLTLGVRQTASLVFRREAMGLGDVDLMAMIGAFMGWHAAVLTFFLAPFFGLAHPVWKLLVLLKNRVTGGQLSRFDRELPFGPYLSMAATTLLFVWPWLWSGWARHRFNELYGIFWSILGINLPIGAGPW